MIRNYLLLGFLIGLAGCQGISVTSPAGSIAGSINAQAPWRTPPIKNTGTTETVSCDLLNASGNNISVSNIVIRVRTLEGDVSSEVVNVPGPITIADGRGIRGSSPAGLLPIRTVYCELDQSSSVSIDDENLLFTMTFDDQTRKAVTTATPRTKKQLTGQ